MLAADGLPYDINNLGEGKEPNQIEVIQHLMPNGARRRMLTTLTEEYATKADNLVISAEMLNNGSVVLYAYKKGSDPATEIMKVTNNGPDVNEKLKELIDELS